MGPTEGKILIIIGIVFQNRLNTIKIMKFYENVEKLVLGSYKSPLEGCTMRQRFRSWRVLSNVTYKSCGLKVILFSTKSVLKHLGVNLAKKIKKKYFWGIFIPIICLHKKKKLDRGKIILYVWIPGVILGTKSENLIKRKKSLQ